MVSRPRLTPAVADVRRAVREVLAGVARAEPELAGAARSLSAPEVTEPVAARRLVGSAPPTAGALTTNGRTAGSEGGGRADVLVALSGGADSLALAAAAAFEAPRAGLRAGAVIVDHGLQEGSADIAERAATQARELGLDPVLVCKVEVGKDGGPEAAARDARYAALAAAAAETGATVVLLGHTLDDQAETVLLGLVRGSGGTSLSGMAAVSPPASTHAGTDADAASVGHVFPFAAHAPDRTSATATNRSNHEPSDQGEAHASGGGCDQPRYARPLLGIRRATTLQFCEDAGLAPWHDPQNLDAAFTRVRVRENVLPVLERELGPGIAEALARTAELAREDSEALDFFAQEQAEELADHAEAGLSLSVKGLANNPAALRQRIIRLAVASEFGVSLSRTHTLEVARLVTGWRGQGELHLPGIRVVRQGGLIVFSAAAGDAQAQR